MSTNTLTCVGCGNRGSSTGFFIFPEDERVRKIWLKNIGFDPSMQLSLTARLCKKHFKTDDLISRPNDRLKLKKHAVPSIRVDPAKTNRRACRYEKTCYVCGKTSADSFHKIPEDPDIRKIWLENVGIKVYDFNPILNIDMRLCSSHFSKKDLIGHPNSLKRRIRKGALPLVQPQNGKNTQREKLTKRNNDEDVDLSDPDVSFVSSSSSNTRCTITVTDNSEEHIKSKISNVNPQNSTLISPRSEKNISSKTVSKSTIFSSKEENSAPIDIIDLTNCEDGELEKKKKHVRRLILKKKLLRKQLAQHRALLDVLLKENDLVTKKGRKVIKEFLRTFLNPAE